MQNFYKEVIEQGIVQSLNKIIKTAGQGRINALHLATVQVLSMMTNPAYGDTYSFPWKRGPHDNLNEYLEASNHFEGVRGHLVSSFMEYDFVKCLINVFNSEDES